MKLSLKNLLFIILGLLVLGIIVYFVFFRNNKKEETGTFEFSDNTYVYVCKKKSDGITKKTSRSLIKSDGVLYDNSKNELLSVSSCSSTSGSYNYECSGILYTNCTRYSKKCELKSTGKCAYANTSITCYDDSLGCIDPSAKPSSSSYEEPSSSSSSSSSSSIIMSSSVKPSSETINPSTGSKLIYIVWVIGILVIGYSIWFFKGSTLDEK